MSERDRLTGTLRFLLEQGERIPWPRAGETGAVLMQGAQLGTGEPSPQGLEAPGLH